MTHKQIGHYLAAMGDYERECREKFCLPHDVFNQGVSMGKQTAYMEIARQFFAGDFKGGKNWSPVFKNYLCKSLSRLEVDQKGRELSE